ncbi:MAG: hypothetical protein NTZ78_02890 [Candidatus Aureabacteria bacterium]|nr:hypothetical protein [Candidatus Auribacterota bacterium]
MKKLITVALSLMLMVGLSCAAIAGSLDSPGAPSAGSGMYTLQNLYDYLTSGSALTVQTGFQEPISGPTTGTMKSTKQIGDDIKSLFDLCATTTAADVKSGKPFFCTVSGSWGVQTGTAYIPPTPTITPTPTQTPTSTPTWGDGRCLDKGGKWLATQLPYPDDFGCWFMSGTYSFNCINVCSAKGLSCKTGNFSDDNNCGVCRSYYPTATCTSNKNELDMPLYYQPGNACCTNTPGQERDCSAFDGREGRFNICVCVP